MTAPTSDLHPRLEPLAFLVGRWEGVGALVYPTIEDRTYLQQVAFSHDGRPFLHYTSVSRCSPTCRQGCRYCPCRGVRTEQAEAVAVLDPFYVFRLVGDALDQFRRLVQRVT